MVVEAYVDRCTVAEAHARWAHKRDDVDRSAAKRLRFARGQARGDVQRCSSCLENRASTTSSEGVFLKLTVVSLTQTSSVMMVGALSRYLSYAPPVPPCQRMHVPQGLSAIVREAINWLSRFGLQLMKEELNVSKSRNSKKVLA